MYQFQIRIQTRHYKSIVIETDAMTGYIKYSEFQTIGLKHVFEQSKFKKSQNYYLMNAAETYSYCTIKFFS